MNERITENIVRDRFSDASEYGFVIEEQQSKNPRINKLLKNASKSGSGFGKPEFIISSEKQPELLIVVECKSDIKKHQSPNLDKYSEYAVDGALLYSSYLSKEFDVIALGVSGQNEKELLASSYLQLKSSPQPKSFSDQLLTLIDFQEQYVYDEGTRLQRYEDLLEYNKELNAQLHSKKIQEDKRSLLISGILIALEYGVFKGSFRKYETAQELAKALVNAIASQLLKSNLEKSRIEVLESAYNFIKSSKPLTSNKDFLIDLIQNVEDRINSFVKTYKYYDIFGEFYTEFLRYANNDKGLGIVLTPKHITELFVDLAYIDKDSIVLDNCCGTGGFLISAMRKMIKDANHDSDIEERIKESQIIGIEYQDTIFTLVCSNMIIHGDGKTNIYNEDCFDPNLIEGIRKKFKPNATMLNPPFKVKSEDIQELNFVLNALEGVEPNSICVAILPMSVMLADKGDRLILKTKILKDHTLEAVFSMPNDLFHNSKASPSTSVIVIKAHSPHPEGYKTYFGYWKEDGFIKRKNKGRIDGGAVGQNKIRLVKSI